MFNGFIRAILALLAGSLLAQALPLLLGPWLMRLYTPAQFGSYTVFVAVSANLAVVACARYEFAIPLARDEEEARDLMALCLRLLLLAIATSMAAAFAIVVVLDAAAHWLWLPFTLGVIGAAQWLTLWATRAQRFTALSASRVVQYGGGSMLQVAGGVAHLGIFGLLAGPMLASAGALSLLRHPSPIGGWLGLWRVPRVTLKATARRYRDFPLLNTPHAFAGALQDTLAIAMLVIWTGEASAGFWGLALRYLKAPASLIGGAVSQALYPRLIGASAVDARTAVRRVMVTLTLIAVPFMLILMFAGPEIFAFAFGERWREAGTLARALAPYIGMHFIASPLAVVTLAWNAQAWALRLALVGQLMFLAMLALGLYFGGLLGGAWAVSASMTLYFSWFFWQLPKKYGPPSMIEEDA